MADTDSVFNKLKNLNPSKAPGPDGIGNRILREYTEVLALPITHQLNASYKEQKLPRAWKQADITPIPKEKPVSNISKHLRPISLTPALSKLAEDFVVEKHIAPAVLKFGGIPRSSATHALISMVHSWAEATDGTGSALRVYLFDYRKAFDLINHLKLAKDCLSEWANIPSGVPQGRKLGPWLFLFMINNAVDSVQTWSTTYRLQLNVAKCKELVISLSKTVNNFPSLNIDSGQLEVVMNARVLGPLATT